MRNPSFVQRTRGGAPVVAGASPDRDRGALQRPGMCDGPPLEPWHTEKLTEEFTAAKADVVRTFDDYLQLEDRLFTQLDEEVYARTSTPALPIPWSATAPAAPPIPRNDQPDWNRSFELGPAEAAVGGVLLLHGMSDSPYSLRALAERSRGEATGSSACGSPATAPRPRDSGTSPRRT